MEDQSSQRDARDSAAREASLQKILERSHDGVLLDRGGQIVLANPSALRTLGYRGEREIFWRPVSDLVHPNDRARLAELLAEMEQDNGGAEPIELRMIRRTGQIAPVEATLISIMFRGQPAVVYLLRDLSERRRMEQQLQLADRMASVGTLAAGVAHELNSPLTYVLANIELVADKLLENQESVPEKLHAEIGELLAEAREGALRMKAILRDLRSFGRADEQRVTEVDVRLVLESVSNMAMNEIRNRAHFLEDYGETPPVRANPNHLNQVFLNLLMNAAHSIPMGNVKDNEVRVSTGIDGSGRVLIQVSDTGCGIDLDIIERIFDPFFTTKDQGVGTGLGLSICHGLVTAMGGEIAVDSIVNEGTTFRVLLPPSRRTP